MPSRASLAKIIFYTFLVIFFGAISLYFFGPLLFDQGPSTDSDQPPTRIIDYFFGFGADPVTDDADDVRIDGSDQPDTGDDLPQRDLVPRIRQISTEPVADAIMYAPATSSEEYFDLDAGALVIRYIDVGTGHVYQASTDTLQVDKISNTTIPGIAEADFVSDDLALIRYVDESTAIKTFVASLRANPSGELGTSKRLQGVFLPDNLVDAVHNDSEQIFYLEPIDVLDGAVRGVVTDRNLQNAVEIFESKVTEWTAQWDGRDQIVLATKPSYDVFGLSYTLNPGSGRFVPYVGGKKAMALTANDGLDQSLVSIKIDGFHSLHQYNQATGDLLDTRLETVADKCVWHPDGVRAFCGVPIEPLSSQEPDLWHQGLTEFTDELWMINENGVAERLFSPFEFDGTQIDVTNMQISPDGGYLYFVNKRDLTLWSYQVD